jgi:hypothetical protein
MRGALTTSTNTHIPRRRSKRLSKTLQQQQQKALKQSPYQPDASPAPRPIDVTDIKLQIADAVATEIRKTPHNLESKPWTKIFMQLADTSVAIALMKPMQGSTHPSDSSKMVWKFWDVATWLGVSNFVHPVLYQGKLYGKPGLPFYAWAGYDAACVSFDTRSHFLTVEIRSYLAGSGFPIKEIDQPPSLFY